MNRKFPPGRPFRPPDEPHSPFYPARGLYSSRDTDALAAQMREIAAAGVDSIMLSWWGQAGKGIRRDSQGVSTDELVPAVLDVSVDILDDLRAEIEASTMHIIIQIHIT